jgi:hypothetical protein
MANRCSNNIAYESDKHKLLKLVATTFLERKGYKVIETEFLLHIKFDSMPKLYALNLKGIDTVRRVVYDVAGLDEWKQKIVIEVGNVHTGWGLPMKKVVAEDWGFVLLTIPYSLEYTRIEISLENQLKIGLKNRKVYK